MRSISLAALTVLELSPLDAARVASRCGYSHIGVRPVAATDNEPQYPLLTDTTMQRELRAILSGEGIGVLDTEIIRLTPEMDWELIESSLAFSADFGAARLLVADNDPDASRSKANLQLLADLAHPYRVTPHLEFMPWTCAPNLAAARTRIAGIDNCALLIDAFHLARSGGAPDEVNQAESPVGYLQLCDISGPIPILSEILREARSDRLFPGEGDIDLGLLVKRLPGIPISLEVPSERLRAAGWDGERIARAAINAARMLLEKSDELSA